MMDFPAIGGAAFSAAEASHSSRDGPGIQNSGSRIRGRRFWLGKWNPKVDGL